VKSYYQQIQPLFNKYIKNKIKLIINV